MKLVTAYFPFLELSDCQFHEKLAKVASRSFKTNIKRRVLLFRG